MLLIVAGCNIRPAVVLITKRLHILERDTRLLRLKADVLKHEPHTQSLTQTSPQDRHLLLRDLHPFAVCLEAPRDNKQTCPVTQPGENTDPRVTGSNTAEMTAKRQCLVLTCPSSQDARSQHGLARWSSGVALREQIK